MRRTMFRRLGPMAVLIGAASVLTTACPEGQQDTPSGNVDCKTKTDLVTTSPGPGLLRFTGQFYADETVMLQTVTNGVRNTVASGTPATDRTSFTFSGLPSGDRFYYLVISCAAGQDDRGQTNYTVM